MKRALRHKEIKAIINSVEEAYSIKLGKKSRYELNENIILIDNEPCFFYYNDRIIPCLRFLEKHDCLKKITVDMGAVRFIAKGADIMRPGITCFDKGIKKNNVIVVIDEKHKKNLAVGISLFSSEELQEIKSGKAVKNLHYAGDKIWRLD